MTLPSLKKSRMLFGLLFLLLPLLVPASPALACSTFVLTEGAHLLVGHNLDQEFHTPGSLFINPRGAFRLSVSGDDLGLTDMQTPVVDWVSRYGSVTFSILGIGLPDGGINEAGLVVSEMALGESQFPFDSDQPSMLIHQWIQYQLDNFATVSEVLEHLNRINIDPRATFTPIAWANYHFLVADRLGQSAAIEFLAGQPVVHSGESLPVPALCNAPYQREMERYRELTGLLGWLYRWLDSDPDRRFSRCAEGLRGFEPERHRDAVTYGFELLSALQFESTKQWSIVYDIPAREIHFRTVKSPRIKSLSLDRVNFAGSATTLVLDDIDSVRSGGAQEALAPFSEARNKGIIRRFLKNLAGFVAQDPSEAAIDRHLVREHGTTLAQLVERAHQVSLRSCRIGERLDVAGQPLR